MTGRYNTRFKLTPMPSSNRWRKIYHGKIHYVGIGHCSSKHDRDGYRVALAEWNTLKDSLDDTPTQVEMELYQAVRKPDPVTMDDLADLGVVDAKADKALQEYAEYVQSVIDKVEGEKPQKKDTVGSIIDEFIAFKMARHQMGELSAMRVVTLRQHLRTVEEVLGRDTPVESIAEETVKQYWGALVAQVKNGEISRTTASDRWHVFKEWVRSVYQIPTPRNLSRRDLSIPRPTKQVVTWAVEEVKSLLARAPERMQLWALLMLNAGMYAGDISNLRPSEVDWERGRIRRKRSKTEQVESCPTVDYSLWGRTFKLLCKYGRRDGERVFLNRDGLPLVQQLFKPNGKPKNQDSIYNAYRHLLKGEAGKPLKALRKTGSSLLDTHDVYVHCVEHYLAHAAHTVTDRSYRNYCANGSMRQSSGWASSSGLSETTRQASDALGSSSQFPLREIRRRDHLQPPLVAMLWVGSQSPVNPQLATRFAARYVAVGAPSHLGSGRCRRLGRPSHAGGHEGRRALSRYHEFREHGGERTACSGLRRTASSWKHFQFRTE